MKKDILVPGTAIALSLGMIAGVFGWMDQADGLSSQTALLRARHWLSDHYAREGIPAAAVKLVDMTAPGGESRNWRFQFQSAATGAVWVEVPDHASSPVFFGKYSRF